MSTDWARMAADSWEDPRYEDSDHGILEREILEREALEGSSSGGASRLEKIFAWGSGLAVVGGAVYGAVVAYNAIFN